MIEVEETARRLRLQQMLARGDAGLTRRALLGKGATGLAVIGMGPTLLAACGGDSGSASDGQVGGTLDWMSFEGYDIPDQTKAWRQQNDVKFQATYAGTQEDVQAKLKGGGGQGLDIVTYQNGFGPFYQDLEILKPIDESKLSNLDGLYPFFTADTGNWWINPAGERVGVPFTWTPLTITYDSAVVDEPQSWDDLFNESVTGQVTVVDDPITVYALAAKVLGLDISRLTSSDFGQVNDWAAALVAQGKGVAASYSDALARLQSRDAAFMVPGAVLFSGLAAAAGKTTIKTVGRLTPSGGFVPKEGAISLCDAWAIPTGTDNEATALSWIDETLKPKVQAAAMDFLTSGVTVEAAVQYIKDPVFPYDQLDEFLSFVPLYTNPPVESDEYTTLRDMYAAWTDVKAGT